jgi:hypothetical protein
MMGFAEGRGVQLIIPDGNEILSWPQQLYGYESHVDGKLVEAYRWAPKGPTVPAAKPGGMPTELTMLDDDPAVKRPPLRTDLAEPPAWERSGHPMPKLTEAGFEYA